MFAVFVASAPNPSDHCIGGDALISEERPFRRLALDLTCQKDAEYCGSDEQSHGQSRSALSPCRSGGWDARLE